MGRGDERESLAWIWIIVGALAVGVFLFWFYLAPSDSERGSDIRQPSGDDQAQDRGESGAEAGFAGAAGTRPGVSVGPEPAAASLADPVGELVLEGQVLDPDGLPAAGAQVSLGSLLTPGERTTTTGPDGAFSFDRLIPSTVHLGARRGSLVGGPIFHQLSAKSDPVVIRLRPGSQVQVVVTAAADGRPVPGARIRLDAGCQLEVLTGPDGLASFEGVAGFGVLKVEARGFAPVLRQLYLPEGAKVPVVVQVELASGAALSGVVLAAEGGPVAGAKVVALDASSLQSADMLLEVGAVSDVQGRFEFPVLAAGSYRLLGSHPDHAPGQVGPIQLDGVRPLSGVELRLSAAGVVRGRVIGLDGRPAAHAKVVAVPPAKSPKRMAGRGGGASYTFSYADGEGAFELRGLPREVVALAAMTNEAVSEEVEVDLGPRPRVEGVVLRLTSGGRIAGKVVDGKGQGIPEAMVTSVANFEDGTLDKAFARRPYGEVMTDGGGGFELTGLVEGTYLLRATRQAGRRDSYGTKPVEARTGDGDVRIVLPEDGGLRGRVVFADGTHPPRFEVVIGFGSALPFEPANGRFEIESLTPGEVMVSIRGPGFALRELGQVKVDAGKVTDLGDVQVERGRRVSGRVTGEDGRPVEGALVRCGGYLQGDGSRLVTPDGRFGRTEDQRQARSDVEGSYELLGVGTAGAVVVAEHERLGRSAPGQVPAGAGDAVVDLVVRGTGSLEGLVRQNGEPLGGCTVAVASQGEYRQSLSVLTGADGRYLVEKVVAGDLNVMASPLGSMKTGITRKSATVRAGERARLDFDLVQGEVSLMLQVQPLPGAHLDAAWVYLLRGRVQARTVLEMRTAARAMEESNIQVEACHLDRPCMYVALTSGEYTACGVPIANFDDETLIKKLHEHMDERRVTCMPILIAASPLEQSAVLPLPAMEPVTQ